VDDASTDGTAELIAKSYPDIHLIRLNKNKGFAGAVNEGVARSKGEYVALLNNDTQAHPEWLSELNKALDENPSTDSCSSKMLFADRPDTINSLGIGFTSSGVAMDVGLGQKDGPLFNKSRPVFGACAGAAIYRRRLFADIGFFDGDLFMWYEDVDFSFRAQLAGHRCLYVPTAIVFHKGGGTVSSNQKLHIYYCCRNQILVLVKNLPGPLCPKYLPRLALLCLKHSIKTLLKGETAAVSGYCRALKDLNLFLKKRKLILSRTVVYATDIQDLMQQDSDSIILQTVKSNG
jgi:hypothetical protein